MKVSTALSGLGLLSGAAVAQTTFEDAIIGTGLIGSHFGVPGIGGQYDYLILGGGTAGLALARRLAADTRYTVAVVEAGDFYEFANGNNTEIPALAATFVGSDPLTHNPYLDWYQWTTNQIGLAGRSVVYMSGKVLGGGSARNFMWYHRAAKIALEKWVDLTGDESYAFDQMLPFYEKSAQLTPPNTGTRLKNATTLYDESLWSPNGGPLQVGWPNWANPISSWIALGLESLGLKNLPGFADGNIDGFAYTSFALDSKTQTRSSASSSFLREALRETTNLNVYKNTMAKQILFDDDKKAIGAIVESGGLKYQLNATQEVIVSSGAFRSPQLLMVSGIGPKKTLDALKIPVISNLAGVGQGMMDHIAFSPSYAVKVTTHSAMSNPAFALEQVVDYQTTRTGQLTNAGGDVLGFARFPNGTLDPALRAELDLQQSSEWPDYEHLFLDGYFGYANDISQGPTDGRNYVSSSTALTNPFSRGTVTINTTDTNDHPVVNPNWLADERDQKVAVAAFARARAVFTQPASKAVVIGEEYFPGLNVSTYDEVLAHIAKSAQASFHSSCTCAMGKKTNPMAVSDSQARVYGVSCLRVVDASAFPVLPPGHPTATVYALAEKIAESILKGSCSPS